MILTTNSYVTYQGLKINKAESALDGIESNAAFPIKIYLLENFQVDRKSVPANFLARRFILLENNFFNFILDKDECWEIALPVEEIKIGVINKEGLDLLLVLLKYLHFEKKIEISNLQVNFYNKSFFHQLAQLRMIEEEPKDKKDLSSTSFESLIIPSKIEPPRLICKTLTRGKWQDSNFKEPFTALRIKSSEGKLQYRVYTKGRWLKWCSNFEIAGEEIYLIKGIQIIFSHKFYDLYYRCTLINGEKTLWRSNPLTIPYKKAITGIDFKFVSK